MEPDRRGEVKLGRPKAAASVTPDTGSPPPPSARATGCIRVGDRRRWGLFSRGGRNAPRRRPKLL